MKHYSEFLRTRIIIFGMISCMIMSLMVGFSVYAAEEGTVITASDDSSSTALSSESSSDSNVAEYDRETYHREGSTDNEAVLDEDSEPDASTASSQTGFSKAIDEIRRGPDYAGQLFNTDKFKPSDVDVSGWTDPVIHVISAAITILCAFFSILSIVVMVVDVFCITFKSINIWVSHWPLQMFSDTCAEITGIKWQPRGKDPGSGGGSVPAAPPAGAAPPAPGGNGQQGNQPFTNKWGYWISQTLIMHIIAGAVLIGLSTGIFQLFVNFCTNFLVNAVAKLVALLKG